MSNMNPIPTGSGSTSFSDDRMWDEVFIRMVVEKIGDTPVVGTAGNDVNTVNDRFRELAYISAALVADEAVAYRRSHFS